jgi:O-antigen ligase
MLLPSWLLGSPWSRARLAAIGILGAVLAIIVILLGARAVWLAIAVATVALGIFPLASAIRSAGRRGRFLVVGVSAGVVGALLLLAGPILDRLLAIGTIDQRLAMWSSSIEAWMQRPIAGFGPGTFPWILQATDYFDTNSHHARHPDSAIFQLLPEGGLFGVAAGVVLITAIGWPLIRRRRRLALWPLAVFLVGSLAGNPTDISYLVVIALIWAALELPRREPALVSKSGSTNRFRLASRVVMVIIAVPLAATLYAGVYYDLGIRAIHTGDLAGGRRSFEVAEAFDPAMAVYVRQSGVASLLLGDYSSAVSDLRQATKLQPGDDLSWRALAIALHEAGEAQAADEALASAIGVQRADQTNMLLQAAWMADRGKTQQLNALLPEVVLSWPTVMAAPGWDRLAGAAPAPQLIADAIERWQTGLASPEPLRGQPLTLVTMGERDDLVNEAETFASIPASLVQATVAVGSCDPAKDAVLDAIPSDDRSSSVYWALRLQSAAESGRSDPDALRLYTIATASTPTAASAADMLNPLHENNDRGSVDSWGYDRAPVGWKSSPIQLPRPAAGADRFIVDPAGARAAMGLNGPGSCTGP